MLSYIKMHDMGTVFSCFVSYFYSLKVISYGPPRICISSAKISDVCVAKFTCFVRTRNPFPKLQILVND